ncbi:MAG: hypothetical protein RL220_1216 [Bacteroidota bacterium]
MKMKYSFLKFWSVILILGATVFITSCEYENSSPGRVRVTFEATFKGQPFIIGSQYDDELGNIMQINTFMSYFSMLQVVRQDDSKELIRDFALVNFNGKPSFELEMESGDMKGIEFNIGIPKAYNKDVDPTTYPNSHPLSVQGSQGMFWHWNTGYIFTKFEGMADTTGTGTALEHPFAFHIGDDPMFRVLPATQSFSLEPGEVKDIRIIVQVDKILKSESDEIDLATDYLTHTSGNIELATRFMNNFKNAIIIQ